jgi:primosomal protein N'
MLGRGSKKIAEITAEELSVSLNSDTPTDNSLKSRRLDFLQKKPLSQENYIATLKRMRELYAIPEVREYYLTELEKRKADFETLSLGKAGAEQVAELDREMWEIKKQKYQAMVEKYILNVHGKLSDIERENLDRYVREADQLIKETAGEREQLRTQNRETAIASRLADMLKLSNNNYKITNSIQDIMDHVMEKLCAGNHVLVYGDTGTGKTAVAREIGKAMSELLGEPVEILKKSDIIQEMEAIDKAYEVLSVSSSTTPTDFIGKMGLEGQIKTKFSYGKVLKAFIEGKICIIDEIDSGDDEILMRVIDLFVRRP